MRPPQMRVLARADRNSTKRASWLAAEADALLRAYGGRHKVADNLRRVLQGRPAFANVSGGRAPTLPLLPVVLRLLRHLQLQICWQKRSILR